MNFHFSQAGGLFCFVGDGELTGRGRTGVGGGVNSRLENAVLKYCGND